MPSPSLMPLTDLGAQLSLTTGQGNALLQLARKRDQVLPKLHHCTTSAPTSLPTTAPVAVHHDGNYLWLGLPAVDDLQLRVAHEVPPNPLQEELVSLPGPRHMPAQHIGCEAQVWPILGHVVDPCCTSAVQLGVNVTHEALVVVRVVCRARVVLRSERDSYSGGLHEVVLLHENLHMLVVARPHVACSRHLDVPA